MISHINWLEIIIFNLAKKILAIKLLFKLKFDLFI